MKENRTLLDAEPGKTYRISQVDTNDEEMERFLLRLGCYPGEPRTADTAWTTIWQEPLFYKL